jgi:hypothetical protein
MMESFYHPLCYNHHQQNLKNVLKDYNELKKLYCNLKNGRFKQGLYQHSYY